MPEHLRCDSIISCNFIYIVVITDHHAYNNPWTVLFSNIPFHKRKGGQVRFTNDQTVELERKFSSQKYLSPSDRKKVAKKLHLSERQVGADVLLTRYRNYRKYEITVQHNFRLTG